MEQDNKDQSLRDAVRDAMQDAMRDQNQMMQQMLQTMQAMMARMEVQNRAQPIRVEERDGIDGGRERGFENLEAPPIRREQQRHDVGLPRYFDQPPYFENQNRWEASFRVEIPEFKGGINPDEYVDWTLQVDDVFRLKEVPLDKQVPLVTIRFRDRAAAWWHAQHYRRYMDGRPPLASWAALKQEMNREFLPPNHEQILYSKLHSLTQGDSGRSCEESNSTDPKEEEEEKPRREDGNPEEEAGSGGGQADLTAGGGEKTTGEGSYNGSSDTIAKGAAAVAAEADHLPQPQTGESGESVAESKGGEAEKHEADEDSLIAKRIAAESQPLVSFLEIIRSNEYGSIFEHRLESQENGRYRSVIRQHVDLEMMRAKLEHGGGRLYTSVEFFRDLLLLCNNAIVFYPKSSSESTAAVHLRQLVAKEMATSIRKPARPPTAVESAPPSQPPEPKFKEDPDMASSLFEQPTSSIPMITCRKRSSISTKAKEERDEKHDSARKERESEEQNLSAKKTINERSATRGVRTNKSRNGNRAGGGGGAAAGKSLNSSSSPSHKSKPMEITAAEQVRKVEDRVSDLQEIHATVRAKLEQTYAKYKAKADQQRRQQSFEVGDLVWVYLPRERYPQGAFTKLKPKKIGPCQVLEKFGDNAYRVELPDDVFISDVFNIRHLTPYAGENSSLRSSFSEEGESDEDISSDQSLGQSNQALDVPVPATQSQQATSGKSTPGSLRRSKRLQNKRA